MATMVGGPSPPSAGLTEPLYTLPNPPSPILSSLLKLLVASLSSVREKTLRLPSLSLYISGMLRAEGDGREPVDLAARLVPAPELLSLLVVAPNSGAEFPPLLHLRLNMSKQLMILRSQFTTAQLWKSERSVEDDDDDEDCIEEWETKKGKRIALVFRWKWWKFRT